MKIALKHSLGILAVSLVAAMAAQAQTVIYNFGDATSQGWYNGGFSATTPSTVTTIGAQNYIALSPGGFQVANVTSSTSTLPGFAGAMAGAAASPSTYTLSYDYYINTAAWTGATYLQIGTFVNSGSGYYAQNYGATAGGIELDGTAMASGLVYSGTVTATFSALGYTIPTTDTFFRLGLIVNSNGQGAADFTNISISPVPEPTTLAFAGLGFAGLIALRRRQA